MKKLVLDTRESLELKINGFVVIKRNGFYLLVETEIDNYFITIISPYDKVVTKL